MNAPSSQYRVPVLEALCAFVRDNTRNKPAKAEDKTVNDKPATEIQPLATDVQAALTVIGRRNPGPGSVKLAGANIPGASLPRAHLEGANLSEAHLADADLGWADLEGAFLPGAHLEGAWLIGAHLEGANLHGADLRGAHLEGADLRVAMTHGPFLPLTQEQIEAAYGDAATRLPAWLTRPARWPAATDSSPAPAEPKSPDLP